MKHIDNIINLTEKALRNGEALGRKPTDSQPYSRDGRVYRATWEEESEEFRLYHYGTLILKVTDPYGDQDIQIGAGAYSVSDRDAINSALWKLGIGGTETQPHARIRGYELQFVEGGESDD